MMRPESPDTVCPICYDGIKNRCQPNACRHGFCLECLKKWSYTRLTCPMCVQPFASITYVKKNGTLGTYEVLRSKNIFSDYIARRTLVYTRSLQVHDNTTPYRIRLDYLETTVRKFVMLEVYAIRSIMEVRVNRHIVRLLVEFVLHNMINLTVDRMAEFLSPFLGSNSLQFAYELKGFLALNRSEAEDRDSVPGATGAEPAVDVPSPEMNDFVPAIPSANSSASLTVSTSAGSTVSTSAISMASTLASPSAISSVTSMATSPTGRRTRPIDDVDGPVSQPKKRRR